MQLTLLPVQLASCAAPDIPTYRVIADKEFLPFKEDSFDLALSSLRCVMCLCVMCVCGVYVIVCGVCGVCGGMCGVCMYVM